MSCPSLRFVAKIRAVESGHIVFETAARGVLAGSCGGPSGGKDDGHLQTGQVARSWSIIGIRRSPSFPLSIGVILEHLAWLRLVFPARGNEFTKSPPDAATPEGGIAVWGATLSGRCWRQSPR